MFPLVSESWKNIDNINIKNNELNIFVGDKEVKLQMKTNILVIGF